ncbi:hypothetical protein V495_03822 [Pseudogymnoascus sp. VKM F-4514 (FW-929)]|nr:hypothetical protein V495_03822 [Pseudogymnoascus sp. VKM F-4514 (FW-929)]KFY54568.1 hypothetical protein V497_07632 [Pseudogymnoascus sp. VKM F-4516 (FW-969)]
MTGKPYVPEPYIPFYIQRATYIKATPTNHFFSRNSAPGTGSYEHHAIGLYDVTMDDTSHSVYLAAGPWNYYSDKTGNGGSCSGDFIGRWDDESHPCVDLDAAGFNGRRIKCVENISGYSK